MITLVTFFYNVLYYARCMIIVAHMMTSILVLQ